MMRGQQPLEPPRLRVLEVSTAANPAERDDRFGTCFKPLGFGGMIRDWR